MKQHPAWHLCAVVAVLGAMVLGACHRGPVKLSEARGLPRSQQLHFVRLGHLMRDLKCLEKYNWDQPDANCRSIANNAGPALRTIPAEIFQLSPDRYPRLREIMVETVRVQEKVDAVAMAIAIADKSRPAESASSECGRRAMSLEQRIDAAFSIDDPSWGDEWRSIAPTPITPKSPPVAVNSPEPVKKEESATPEEKAPAPSAAMPVAVDGGVPAPAEVATPVEGPKAAALVAPLKESIKLITGAEHEASRLLAVSAKAQTILNGLGNDLRAFRDVPRPEFQQADAIAYADKVDRARGILLRACTKYASAARRIIQVTADDFVFREADDLLEKAEAEVDTLAKTIPPSLK